MTQHDILRVSSALRDDMRMETLYQLICDYGDVNAAMARSNASPTAIMRG